MAAEIVAGLSRQRKQISPKFFYDEAGSRLFDEICELPEYYLTRTELAIMQANLGAIAGRIGPRAALIEPGAGSGRKTQLLLAALADPVAYVPVDISGGYLANVARRMAEDFPDTAVLPVIADFTAAFELPVLPPRAARKVVFFPGATIGNFSRREAVAFLARMREAVQPAGGLLIGVDLLKPREMLIRAYNDAAGVTARFNLNVLQRLNREFAATFRPETFRHKAAWDEAECRIEMRLISRIAQRVRVADHWFHFAADEYIVTEHSHKYTVDGFAALAGGAGFRLAQAWTDPERLFSVQCFD
jgi:dimethylhistidine N-methyltransferase